MVLVESDLDNAKQIYVMKDDISLSGKPEYAVYKIIREKSKFVLLRYTKKRIPSLPKRLDIKKFYTGLTLPNNFNLYLEIDELYLDYNKKFLREYKKNPDRFDDTKIVKKIIDDNPHHFIGYRY